MRADEAEGALGDALLTALDLRSRRYVFVVGSGGKTTLLFTLAGALARAGRAVITSTSTRIFPPTPEQSPRLIVEADPDRLIAALSADQGHATVVGARRSDGKLQGLSLPALDRLHEAGCAQHLLVEADGARGLPLKAHGPDEPVVSPAADLVIAVVGADSVGRPPTDEHVHRAALLRQRLGLHAAVPLSARDVARALLHPQGFLQGVAAETEVRIVIARAHAAPEQAEQLAEALGEADTAGRVTRVIIAELLDR